MAMLLIVPSIALKALLAIPPYFVVIISLSPNFGIIA
jgi:hypothetical protein